MQNFPGPVNYSGYQSLFQGCSLNEWVRLENGNFMPTLDLISVPTIGPNLRFYMVYNSRSAGTNSGFGYGWTHNWQAKITPSTTAPIFTDDTGQAFTFQATLCAGDYSSWAHKVIQQNQPKNQGDIRAGVVGSHAELN